MYLFLIQINDHLNLKKIPSRNISKDFDIILSLFFDVYYNMYIIN